MLCKVTHCAGCVSAITRLRVFKSLVETPRKHHLFAQLSCVRRSYISDHNHYLSRLLVHAYGSTEGARISNGQDLIE